MYKIIEQDEFEVFGLSVEITKSQDKNYKIISEHWKKFNQKLKFSGVPNNSDWEKYGVTYKINGTYFYKPSVPFEVSGFEKSKINKSSYAQFQHKGDMKFLKTTIYNIYKKILPNSDLITDSERVVLHYEKYDYRFNWNKAESIIDIFIPIK